MTPHNHLPTDHTPVVLVGATYAEASPALNDLADVIGATTAYLLGGNPTLTTELDRLCAAGATTITLVYAPVSDVAPTRSWVRRVAGHWKRSNPGIEINLATASSNARCHTRSVTGTEAPLKSVAWNEATQHHHHILVCRGPRCSARGAGRVFRELSVALEAAALGDEDIMYTPTGCLIPCNHGPLVVVYPEDAWYGPVAAEDMTALVHEIQSGACSASRALPHNLTY